MLETTVAGQDILEEKTKDNNEIKKGLKEKYGLDLSDDDLNEAIKRDKELSKENIKIETKRKVEILYLNILEEKLKNGELFDFYIGKQKNGNEITKENNNVDNFLSKYHMFSTERKEILKIGISNAILKKEDGNFDLDKSLGSYLSLFDEINEKLKGKSPEEQQSIINKITFFSNITSIESYNENNKTDIIKELDGLLNGEKKDDLGIKIDTIKDFFDNNKETSSIQAKIESKIENMTEEEYSNQQTKFEEMAKDESKNSLLNFLLKIPILGQIIAFLLGLDGENPIEELENYRKNAKSLNVFKDLGKKETKDGEKDAKEGEKENKDGKQEGVGPFKDINLSGINYDVVRDNYDIFCNVFEIKDLSVEKQKEFFIKIFTEGVKIKDGKILKLDLPENVIKSKEMTNKDFINILNKFLKENDLYKDNYSDRSHYLKEGEKYLGIPYEMGGNSTKTLDCSAFVSKALKIPRDTAQGLYNKSQKIDYSEMKPGDLVFFKGTYKTGDGKIVTHVGIYAGKDKNGNEQMLHCGRKKGVGYQRLNIDYWKSHFYGSGRL